MERKYAVIQQALDSRKIAIGLIEKQHHDDPEECDHDEHDALAEIEDQYRSKLDQDVILNEGIERLIDRGDKKANAQVLDEKICAVEDKIMDEGARLRREFKTQFTEFEARLKKE